MDTEPKPDWPEEDIKLEIEKAGLLPQAELLASMRGITIRELVEQLRIEKMGN